MFSTGCNFYSATRGITTLVRMQFFSVYRVLGCGGGGQVANKKNNSVDFWHGGRDELAFILQTLFPNLKPLLYYVLRYLKQPVWLPLSCLFWYQLFICLTFYAVLLENLAMEHLTRRGSKLKIFHLHTELLHVSRGLRICLPPSFMMGIVISTIISNRYYVSVQKMQF